MANQLEISREPAGVGDQFTLSLKRPVPVGCVFEVYINDKRVQPGDNEAGFTSLAFAHWARSRSRPGRETQTRP
jgi:hypothetical protein